MIKDELKQALERKEPSPDFEARVKAAAGRLPMPPEARVDMRRFTIRAGWPLPPRGW